MKTPFYVFTRENLALLLAIFLLGIILGSTTIHLFVSSKVDLLILEKKQLEIIINENETRIQQLEKNLKEHRQDFIKKININLDTDLDEHRQQELKNKIYELLKELMGKNIEDLDFYFFIEKTLDNRQIKLENRLLTLHLKLISFIQDELNIIIETETE